MARRRRPPAAVDVDGIAVPVELTSWDHPTWRDRVAFAALLDRIDPGHRPPPDLPNNPGQRFDYVARIFASAAGLVDPRYPNSCAAGLAAVGVRLAGTRRRLSGYPSGT